MAILRLFHSFFVLILVVLSTLAISVAALAVAKVLRRGDGSVQGLARSWAKLILLATGVQVTRSGGSALDPDKPYIFAANHQSQYDIFVFQGYLGHDFRWMAKKELFQVPVWGGAMKAAGYIPVDRSGGRAALKSLSEAAAKISGGTSVVVFPEGTRSPDGRLGEFKAGGMQLAIKAGVPVVPVAVAGTQRILPKGKFLARPGRVQLVVGDPVPVDGFGPKQKQELAGKVRAAVAALLEGTEPGIPAS